MANKKERMVRVGYYGGRGYWDCKPKRWVREFKCRMPLSVARNDDRCWEWCEAHLRKRYPSKNPEPTVSELWHIDDIYGY